MAMAKTRHTREMIIPTWLMRYKENSICQEGDIVLREGLKFLQAEKELSRLLTGAERAQGTFLPLTLRVNQILSIIML